MNKNKLFTSFFILFLILNFFGLQAHEGHHHVHENQKLAETSQLTDPNYPYYHLKEAVARISHLHFIFIHFPIALLVMTVAAEILFWWTGTALYTSSARFMINAAAVFAIPTVLFGFALSFGTNYEGTAGQLFEWHQFFGFTTALLAICCAMLKELSIRKASSSITRVYGVFLLLVFLSVSMTGYLGGALTFGLTGF